MTDSNDVVRRVPDADLGSIFGNRTEGLGGLAPRRARTTPSSTDGPKTPTELNDPIGKESSRTAKPTVPSRNPEESPARAGGDSRPTKATASPEAPSSRRGNRSSDTEAGGDPSPVPRLVILQLPNDVADRLRENARQRGMTYKELTLDAVEATVDQLPDLIAAQRPRARKAGLFAGERVAAQVRPEGRRQVSIKLSESSISSLDALATQHGARSRSELVSIALSEYLAD